MYPRQLVYLLALSSQKLVFPLDSIDQDVILQRAAAKVVIACTRKEVNHLTADLLLPLARHPLDALALDLRRTSSTTLDEK